MSSSIHNLRIIPEHHPLFAFLTKLPINEACDPNPDWIEEGSSKRFILSFRGDNANARMSSLSQILTREQPWICKISAHTGPGNAYMIIFLQDFRPGSEFLPFTKNLTNEDWEPVNVKVLPFKPETQLALPEAPQDKPLPGCKQMESYD